MRYAPFLSDVTCFERPLRVNTSVTPGVGPLQGSPSTQIGFGSLIVPRSPAVRVAAPEPTKAIAPTTPVAARTAPALTMPEVCPHPTTPNLRARGSPPGDSPALTYPP